MTKIAVDNIDVLSEVDVVDLSDYREPEEKYVHAVDNLVDIVLTNDVEVAELFRAGGIEAFVEV